MNETSESFFQSDHKSLTVRFEDLLLNPEVELRKMCQLIGEEFEPGMLDTTRSIGHLNPTQISWKQKAGEEIDPKRIAVWRRETTPEEQCQAEAVLGDRLNAYGYPTWCKFDRYIEILNLGILKHFPPLVNHLLDGKTRFWKAHPLETPQLRIFVGDPCQDNWIGPRRRDRLAKTLHVGACAASAMVTGIPLIWVGAHTEEEIKHWGTFQRVIASLLQKRVDVETFCVAPNEPIAPVGTP